MLVDGRQNEHRVVAGLRGRIDHADDKGDQHAGTQTLARHITEDEKGTSVVEVGDDLKEVSTDFTCGTVFAFDT